MDGIIFQLNNTKHNVLFIFILFFVISSVSASQCVNRVTQFTSESMVYGGQIALVSSQDTADDTVLDCYADVIVDTCINKDLWYSATKSKGSISYNGAFTNSGLIICLDVNIVAKKTKRIINQVTQVV